MVTKHARLSIRRVRDSNGVWVDDVAQIKDLAVDFFSNLYKADSLPAADNVVKEFLGFVPSLVFSDDNVALLALVTLEEV